VSSLSARIAPRSKNQAGEEGGIRDDESTDDRSVNSDGDAANHPSLVF